MSGEWRVARGRLESREAYIPVLFISIASISSPPTPRRVTAATKSSNDLNADDGPAATDGPAAALPPPSADGGEPAHPAEPSLDAAAPTPGVAADLSWAFAGLKTAPRGGQDAYFLPSIF